MPQCSVNNELDSATWLLWLSPCRNSSYLAELKLRPNYIPKTGVLSHLIVWRFNLSQQWKQDTVIHWFVFFLIWIGIWFYRQKSLFFLVNCVVDNSHEVDKRLSSSNEVQRRIRASAELTAGKWPVCDFQTN